MLVTPLIQISVTGQFMASYLIKLELMRTNVHGEVALSIYQVFYKGGLL